MIKRIRQLIDRVRHPEHHILYPVSNTYIITIVSGRGTGEAQVYKATTPWGEEPDESSRCVIHEYDGDIPLTIKDIRRWQKALEDK